jgi:hypothetical protein
MNNDCLTLVKLISFDHPCINIKYAKVDKLNGIYLCKKCNYLFCTILSGSVLIQTDYLMEQLGTLNTSHNVLAWYIHYFLGVTPDVIMFLIHSLPFTQNELIVLEYGDEQFCENNPTFNMLMNIINVALPEPQAFNVSDQFDAVDYKYSVPDCRIEIPYHSIELALTSICGNKIARWLFMECASPLLECNYESFHAIVKVLNRLYQNRYITKMSHDPHWVGATVRYINAVFRKSVNEYIQKCSWHQKYHNYGNGFIIRDDKSKIYHIIRNNFKSEKRNCCKACRYLANPNKKTEAMFWPFDDECDFQLEAVFLFLILGQAHRHHYNEILHHVQENGLFIIDMFVDMIFHKCPRTCQILKMYFIMYGKKHPVVCRTKKKSRMNFV